MRTVTLIFCLFSAVVVCGSLYDELEYHSTLDDALKSSSSLLENLDKLEISSFLSEKSLGRLLELPPALSALSKSPETELALCAAGRKTLLAIARAPDSTVLPILYAFLWDRGESLSCFAEHSAPEVLQAVARALKREPYSPAIHLAGARWFFKRGMTKAMLPALRTYVRYEFSPDPLTIGFVLDQLLTRQDYFMVVPATFPQFARWGIELKRRAPERFDRWREELERGVVDAIENATDFLERDPDGAAVVQQWLQLSYLLESGDTARKAADHLLARVAEKFGDAALAEYLRMRSGLESIPIIVGVREYDSRPERGELFRWGSVESFVFNESNRSLGFYVPAGWQVQTIELLPDSNGARLGSSSLQPFISNDNDSWFPASGQLLNSHFVLDGSETTVLQYDSEYYPYVKLHHQGSGRLAKFKNAPSKMVRVYGLRG